MMQRILPIYHTGWFYLLLIFCFFSFWFTSIGGLNKINQLNINYLAQFTPTQAQEKSSSALASSDILTLHSSFDDTETTEITTLLSAYPHSQVTLLGELPRTFVTKIEHYLSTRTRDNKVIIASEHNSSEQALHSFSPMLFTSILDWFRFSPNEDVKQSNSEHLIFTPFLVNNHTSFPLLWQQQGEILLTLPGEMLKQLSKNTELTLNQTWQLNLSNKHNTLIPQQLPLGFFGDVFTSDETHTLLSPSQTQPTSLDITGSKTAALISVSQFITQKYNYPLEKYKVIIITDNKLIQHKQLLPLFKKLIKSDYLSQNISTLLLCYFLAAIGLTLAWLIRQLPFRQQLIFIVTYTVILFVIQYLMFKQQQWLEVIPLLLLLTGSWLILLAYQKECNLIISLIDAQLEHASLALTAAKSTKAITNQQNSKVQSELVHTLSNQPKELVAPIKRTTVSESNSASTSTENFDQTLVIVDNPGQHKNPLNHHLTVDSFGRYQVEGVLGKGAMGIVYQGVDPKINRHVAIKTLQISDDIDSPDFNEAKDRFFREAQTAGGLSHANIVTIYDVGEENNLGYIAMDLLTGAPLSLFTQPGQTLPVPLVYQLLIQISDALDYAHKQNVVHRDIKPANIIYDDDLLKVTVTDFGIAYVSDNSKTRTGIIMGSPYYMSPEQILGLKVDGRSDIFSLGVTFYQLLCGHLPFEGESIATVAYQITKAKAVAVNQRNPKLPSSALRICNKAMHKDIEKRYQSMAEFKLALTNALKRDFKITEN